MTLDVKAKLSEAMKLHWENDQSIYNSSEYQENWKNMIKSYWNDPNSKFNSPDNRLKHKQSLQKTYKIIDLNGAEFIIKGISDFCKKEKLNTSAMCAVANGKRNHHKNWKCFYEINNEN
jgi:hypothetical protein